MSEHVSRPVRAGEGLLTAPSMAVWAETGSKLWDAYGDDWFDHIHVQATKHNKDLAEPCIWGRKLCLRGGLKPRGENYASLNHEFILSKDGEYHLVHMEDIRPPTSAEYNKYFKKMYEENPPVIKTSKRSGWETTRKYIEVRFIKGKVNNVKQNA